jgi:hypothetical protein
LVRAEVTHAVVAALATAVSAALATRSTWLGLLAGAVIGAANLHVLGLLAQRITQGSTRTKGAAVLGLVLKMGAVAAAVAATMFWLKPQPLALMAGLTLAPATLVLVAYLAAPSTHDAESSVKASDASATVSAVDTPGGAS